MQSELTRSWANLRTLYWGVREVMKGRGHMNVLFYNNFWFFFGGGSSPEGVEDL